MREKKPGMMIIGVFALCGLVIAACAFASRAEYAQASRRSAARQAVQAILGKAWLGASNECSSACAGVDGLCGCMPDVAAGYRHYQDCVSMAASRPEVL